MNMTLDKAIFKLLKEKPFLAHFIMNSTIYWDKFNVPTAGATVINFSTVLVFNTEFMSKLNEDEYCGVLEHEVYHLLFDHMDRKNRDKQIYNIAADCAINQHIKTLPEGAIYPHVLEKVINKPVEKFQNSDYYYALLMQHQDKIPKQMGPIDDHDMDGIPDQGDAKQKEVTVKRVTSEAVKAAKGNVPEHLKSMVENLLKPEAVPWQQILRNFVSKAVSSTTIGTRTKVHRRFDLDAPGKRKKRELTLGICVDSSGSVSNELFSTFLNEVQHITKNVGKVYLIDADCVVQKVEVLTKKKKIKFERNGYGGTAYQPAIDESMRLKCDAIIYFGDGDAADVPNNPKVPFLWAFPNSNCKPPGAFGKVVYLNEK